jgi:hypothetical protein
MAIGIITAIAIAVLLFSGPAGASTKYGKRRLRRSFGPEYDLVAQEYGDTRAADRELRRRRRLHRTLRLEKINLDDQEYYAASWERVQGGFLDNPIHALKSADELVGYLLDARGYPDDHDRKQLSLLSVKHAGALVGYREAKSTLLRAQADSASAPAEEMRRALTSYRALFDEVLGVPGAAARRPVETMFARPTQTTPEAPAGP